ncbi:D-beta-hydroxybutyrate dehydrogenase, mitochondrial-like [Penaeus indicus]|uniref:D-beta-hydroxybutyrate dehydrogenase, mitochondrial-like n=1 Tax=Penaeus indicus TaxID=29960 RepID=UPI00300D0F8C
MLWTLDTVSRLLFWCGLSLLLAGVSKVLIPLSFWLTFSGAFLVLGNLHLLLASFEITTTGKAVLVTGCDSGFGYALALRLDALGFHVFAGCLQASGESARDLASSASSRLRVIQLDITKEEEVNAALKEVKDLLSPGGKGFHVFAGCLQASGESARDLASSASSRLRVIQLDITKEEEVNAALKEVKDLLSPGEELWGLVNNAGISTFGAVEWTSLPVFREVADVNLFGHIRVTKAFLPLIRKSKGRLVNVTSAEGRFTAPFVAAYELTKHAMEAFSDCLRHEMQRFGVHVCVVEPGNYTAGTKLNTAERAKRLAASLWSAMTDEVRHAYGKNNFDRVVSSMESVTNTGLVDLTSAVDAMTKALTQRYPQARYTCMDSRLYIRGLVAQHMPEWIYDFLYVNEVRNVWYN